MSSEPPCATIFHQHQSQHLNRSIGKSFGAKTTETDSPQFEPNEMLGDRNKDRSNPNDAPDRSKFVLSSRLSGPPEGSSPTLHSISNRTLPNLRKSLSIENVDEQGPLQASVHCFAVVEESPNDEVTPKRSKHTAVPQWTQNLEETKQEQDT